MIFPRLVVSLAALGFAADAGEAGPRPMRVPVCSAGGAVDFLLIVGEGAPRRRDAGCHAGQAALRPKLPAVNRLGARW